MTEMTPICFEFQSGEHEVRASLERLLSGLGTLDLDQDDMGTIEIVMAEVLNNIVEHAYPPGSPQGIIRVNCLSVEDTLQMRVEDFGKPMPDGQAPAGKAANLDVDLQDLPEGGFGWFMIHTLSRHVHYEREDDQNILSFALPVRNNSAVSH